MYMLDDSLNEYYTKKKRLREYTLRFVYAYAACISAKYGNTIKLIIIIQLCSEYFAQYTLLRLFIM